MRVKTYFNLVKRKCFQVVRNISGNLLSQCGFQHIQNEREREREGEEYHK